MEDPTTIALNLTYFGTLGVAFVMFVGLFLVFVATLLIVAAGRLATVFIMALFGRVPHEDTVKVVHLSGPLPAHDGGAPTSQPGLSGPTEHRPATGNVSFAIKREAHVLTRWVENLAPARIQHSLQAAVERLPLMRSVRPNPAEMSPDWAAAVARADARAKARARAEAPPQITATALDRPVADLPLADAPTGRLTRIAPLVESATANGKREKSIPAKNSSAKNSPAKNSSAKTAAITSTPNGDTPRSFVKPPPPGNESLLDTGSLASLAVRKGKSPIRK